MIAALRTLHIRSLALAVIIPLIGGWLAALVFALGIAAIQYGQVQAAFPADQVGAEFQSRIAREFGRGLLLFLPQVGLMAALLAWQIMRRSSDEAQPVVFGAVAGLLLAMVQTFELLLIAESWFYMVGLALLLIGAGAFGGWLAGPAEDEHEAI
jgi:hypothetical protein